MMAGFFFSMSWERHTGREGDPVNKNKLKSKISHFREVHLPLDRNEVGRCNDGDVGMSRPGLHQALDSFHMARQQNLLPDEPPAQSPSLAFKYTR